MISFLRGAARGASSSCAAAPANVRFFATGKRRIVPRQQTPWKDQLKKMQWPELKKEMVSFFQHFYATRDSTVDIHAAEWPRFVQTMTLYDKGFVPCSIMKHGPECRAALPQKAFYEAAFDDDPKAHVSHLLKGRLFRIHVPTPNGMRTEEAVVTYVKAHPVDREIYFCKMARHVPGKLTQIEIPVTLVGLQASPGRLQGYTVTLNMPTVKIETIGKIPPPFKVDVSQFSYKKPYNSIPVKELEKFLPADGTIRLSRDYTGAEDVVLCYNPKETELTPLPADYHQVHDPNFQSSTRGTRYSAMHQGVWPKPC